MKTFFLAFIGVLVIVSMTGPSAFSQNEEVEGLIDLEKLSLSKNDFDADSLDVFSNEMITKKIDGVVDHVGDDFIIIRDDDENQVKLIVDAETVLYLDEKKSEISAVEAGANAFAFYVEESGLLKCDFLDVTQE